MIIQSDGKTYPIIFCNEHSSLRVIIEEEIKNWLRAHIKCEKILIITDYQVEELYKSEIEYITNATSTFSNGLLDEPIICTYVYKIPAGEKSKDISYAEAIWSYLAGNEFSRNDLLIAFGGGVVGDLAGFCASTYMRGISYIQIPTTLISQIDSSVGGKVAINLEQGKNLVGAFYNPEMVIINPSFLNTLEDYVFLDGLGELLKYGFLGDSQIFEQILEYSSLNGLRIGFRENPKLVLNIIKNCLIIKKVVVENDFEEKGLRMYLNYGHTIGHAIERLTNYNMSHGTSVANGCLWALKIAGQSELAEQFEMLIKRFGMPLFEVNQVEAVINLLRVDKKSTGNGVQVILYNGTETLIKANSTGSFNYEALHMSEMEMLSIIEKRMRIEWISFERLEKLLIENTFD